MIARVLVGTLLFACAAGPATNPGAPATPRPAPQQETMVPAGFGTLHQDEITVSLRDGALLVKLTPLDEGVIRLLAPDTYQRLHALAENRKSDADAAASAPDLFLVSFFSYQPNTTFQPENLQLSYQGRLLQPVGVFPLTSGFGRVMLDQQDSESAIYVFDGPIDYQQRFVVRYGMTDNSGWNNIIPRLEVERAKARARAGGEQSEAPGRDPSPSP